MKLFPHSFVPFFHVYEKEGATKTSAKEETTALDIKRDAAGSKKPLRLDVETAVDLMLSAQNVDDDTLRQKYRLHIIKTLPADAIDWKTVDWVQVWPFQTTRS
jgi:hypothetical protein